MFTESNLVYDEIVCLGSNCQVTWNIKDFFGIEKAFPFDWWITPYESLLSVLRNKFDGLFELENLKISEDRITVTDTFYNLLYHHDFKRDSEDLVEIDNIEEQLETVRQKYNYLAKRFLNDLQGKKVLFVRNHYHNGSPYLQSEPTTIDLNYCLLLCETLSEILPTTDFDLFFTNSENPALKDFEFNGINILFDSIVDYGDADNFRRSPKGWREMLERREIKLAATTV